MLKNKYNVLLLRLSVISFANIVTLNIINTMLKKHFNQILLVLVSFLAIPLHAVQYNDSQKKSSNQHTNYTPNQSNRQIDNKVKPKDLEKEKEYLEQELKIHEQHYGGTHPKTAKTMKNLGTVLSDLDDYASAKTHYEKALKINEKHYGHNHPSTAMTMGNLGNLCKELGQYEKARGYYEKTIAIFTRHYGPNHAITKKAKGLLATMEKKIAFRSDQKQPKSALGNSLNKVTNKLYKVNKWPKDDDNDDEKDEDSEETCCIVM